MAEDDTLNIEAEDLEEPAPPPSSEDGGSLLVIDHEDLQDAAPLPQPVIPHREPVYGTVPLTPPAARLKSSVGAGPVLTRGLAQMALAGAIGGFLAWIAVEPFMNDALSREESTDLTRLLLAMTLFGGVLGGLIGAALGAAEGVTTGNSDRLLRGGAAGLLIGFVGGAAGGASGQLLYGGLMTGTQPSMESLLRAVAVRALAWMLVGIGVGLAQGAGNWTPRKLVNGVLGGGMGGFLGGLLFDPLSLLGALVTLGAEGAHAAWFSRLLAMVVLGACTGAAIGLVEELRKEAWLRVVQGPLAGKQFILYKRLTVIGSSPKADICLLKDPEIRPQHAVLQETPGGHSLLASPEAPAHVNGRLAMHCRLVDGDMVRLGHTVLEYRVRAVRAWVAAAAQAGVEGG